MHYDLLSLDMAGTTFDEGNVVYDVLRRSVADALGTDVPWDIVDRWTGTSKIEAIRAIIKEVRGDADPEKVYSAFSAQLERSYREDPPRPFPGVTEMFNRLRSAGVKVALQTGYAKPITDLILENAGWRIGETVDAVVTSDSVAASRPAPYLIFRTMEATGVTNVRRVLVAGDTVNDLRAGTNAGAGFVVGLLSGAQSVETLGRVPHTHILDRVTDIEALAHE
ncbi:MAG: phosphonatase-like hydrolase [Micrococcus sp.]|nr:phosphonatase-like hydrolase [Micrococcus sp.]